MPWKKGNRLRLISGDGGDGATRRIFAEIKQALGLPVLRVFYPALAAYPQFLGQHWAMLKPVVESSAFFACANRLRADGYTRAHNYLHIPDLCAHLQEPRFGARARQQLTAAIELFHYQNPLLLLLFCAQLQALEGPVGEPRACEGGAACHPIYREYPLFLEEETCASPLRRRYEEIRRVLELPYLNSEYEAMACFPDFLDTYWEYLKPELRSPIYRECLHGFHDAAWSLARELPGPLELTIEQLTGAGMKPEDIVSVARILGLFVKNLGGLVMNVAIAKIALEGGNIALPSRLSARPDSERVA